MKYYYAWDKDCNIYVCDATNTQTLKVDTTHRHTAQTKLNEDFLYRIGPVTFKKIYRSNHRLDMGQWIHSFTYT